jgi:hypothetical protein
MYTVIEQQTKPSAARTLRPVHQLRGQSRIVSAALVLPVFAAVLWFSLPRGTWPRVLVAFAVVAVAYAIASYLLARVSIAVNHDGIVERGFLARNNRVPMKRIGSVLIVTVYRGQSLETAPQLFVLDSAGELLLRMRGQFWGGEGIDSLAAALDVPIRRVEGPITRAALRRDFTTIIYWFERWPWLGALCIAGGIAAASILLILAMSPESLVIPS